mmetsp:Transcript_42070/g.83211  ORF Transcript_42070/g.83211 Transcript_42070/m.83211 type:complete len:129 (-) Transcript_42070:734-1120(-)
MSYASLNMAGCRVEARDLTSASVLPTRVQGAAANSHTEAMAEAAEAAEAAMGKPEMAPAAAAATKTVFGANGNHGPFAQLHAEVASKCAFVKWLIQSKGSGSALVYHQCGASAALATARRRSRMHWVE